MPEGDHPQEEQQQCQHHSTRFDERQIDEDRRKGEASDHSTRRASGECEDDGSVLSVTAAR